MIERFIQGLFSAAIFLLPWQTQMIFGNAVIHGEPTSFGVFGLYVVEAFIAIVFGFQFLRQRADVFTGTTWKSLYYFLGFAFFSLGFSSVALVGWFFMIHVVSAAMLFFLLTDKQTDLLHVSRLLLLGLLVPVMFGWAQVLTGSAGATTIFGIAAKEAATPGVSVIATEAGRLLRAHGTYPHPNVFGGWLLFGLLLSVWRFGLVETKWLRLEVGVLVCVFSSTLLVTFSRSAWLGLVLAIIFFVGHSLWKRQRIDLHLKRLFAVGLLAFVVTGAFFHQQVLARFTPSLPLETISLEERSDQYQDFPHVFLQKPLFGVGPGSYVFALSQQYPEREVWAYQPVHNVSLLLLAELGMIGFAAFLYLLFSLNPFAHASLKSGEGVFAVTLLLAFFVVSLFDHYLWTLWPGLALSAVVAAYLVSSQRAS